MKDMIPEQFTVGPYDYTVQWISHKKLAKMAGGPAWGACQPDRERILLSKKLLEREGWFLYQVWLHELNHACLYALGYNNHDEVLVDGLASMFTQVLQSSVYEETEEGEETP